MVVAVESNTSRKHVVETMVKVQQKIKGDDIYWKKWLWDAGKPTMLVLANYPASKNVLEEDLTGILIRNAVLERGDYGGVVIANLFTRPVNWPSDKSLSAAFAEDGMTELVKVCREADQVVIAVGSLPSRSLVALARIQEFWQACKKEEMVKKVTLLVNSKGKPVHPLAICNEPWQFSSWKVDWMGGTDTNEQSLPESDEGRKGV
ncbi:DUF1643 domain-containing protein [Levilactobacillus brevis]|uniref:DUF1643 domain-containing protein n=1 Tax=Levilactobacillus brevis TaxID=1580 RepID=UPI00111A871F|nr:DUF1643 domain-containing protein [Levilactobacillus brevis]QCZ46812.1 Hypothetical protein UCCLB556_1937 [Levilactobacillus brevis]